MSRHRSVSWSAAAVGRALRCSVRGFNFANLPLPGSPAPAVGYIGPVGFGRAQTYEPQLRHVETDVLIPKMMREKARERCVQNVEVSTPAVETPHHPCPGVCPLNSHLCPSAVVVQHLLVCITFTACCKDTGFFMVFKCREENAALKECLTRHYQDPEFFQECKQEYIQGKLDYERTGIPNKSRKQKLPTSM
ncbi:COX assembly mitochondrial protein -like protein [Triplophysa tibetana]|uniref:COX assembly mitochondrial protein n=1 Tax=Triplophysa tibetana TaxID=1572043 RepID=A0A5A9N0A4_9TELE|nr:COX assembly mitochondrial protein -like protein [Triplophysa tibetana]